MPPSKPQPWHLRVADELRGLAKWIDEELAAGQPPKSVAQKAAMQLRYFAARLRVEGGRR
jgi:hypothetical protein